jgi:hypothetical protein
VCIESGRAGGASWSKVSLCARGAGRDNCANIAVDADLSTGIASSTRSIAVESIVACGTSSLSVSLGTFRTGWHCIADRAPGALSWTGTFETLIICLGANSASYGIR